ncbi:MAG: hypothetical protein PHE61_00860 [Candidatus Omnitrophica bacterium]|nr:hypothetical protein [Candidatus Omnitrophota bacterium]
MVKRKQPEQFEIVSLDKIAPSSGRFSIRFSLDDPPLRDSIKREGLLVPLTIFYHGGELILLSGFRRREALGRCGIKRSAAFILAGGRLSDKALFLKALDSNLSSSISDLDKALALDKAKNIFKFSEKELEENILPRFGIPPSLKWVKRYLGLLELERSTKENIARGRLSLKSAFALGMLTKEEQKFILGRVLTRCILSSSEISELCELLREIGIRDSVSPLKLLQCKEISLILNKHLDSKNRAGLLLEKFRSMRYPHLVKWEKAFRKTLDSAGFGKGIRLEHPEGFEEGRCTLSLKWNSIGELDRLMEEVRGQRKVLEKIAQISPVGK